MFGLFDPKCPRCDVKMKGSVTLGEGAMIAGVALLLGSLTGKLDVASREAERARARGTHWKCPNCGHVKPK